MSLSIAYKEFDREFSPLSVANATGSFYGLIGLLGLQREDENGLGLFFIANATTIYVNAAYNANSTPPTFARAL